MTTSSGHVMTGGMMSITRISESHVAELSYSSVNVVVITVGSAL